MLLKMRLISLKRVVLSKKYVLLIGIIICLLFLREAITLLKGPQDIMTLAPNEIDNSFVMVELNSVFGLSMEDVSIQNKPAYEYVVSIGENKRMICIRAERKLRSELLPIRDRTKQLLEEGKLEDESQMQLLGIMRKMTSEEKIKYDKFVAELSLDVSQNLEILPYILLPSDTPFGDAGGVYLWAGLGSLLIFIVIYRVIKAILGGYQISLERQLRQLGETETNKIRKDYMESQSFGGDIKVGEKYTYCNKGAKTCFFPTVDILGLYIEDVRKQKKKWIFRKDLYIKLKDGSLYRISGERSGQVINYYKEFYPDIKFNF